MRRRLADLHIHTSLSPCASVEMTPGAIVESACAAGLEIIAVCDHNTAGNVRVVTRAGEGKLTALSGMEITTREEVHVLGIFPDPDSAESAGEEVGRTLPRMKRKRMLSGATTFGLEETVKLVKRHGGLAIASHVLRPSFSVTSQLGMLPRDAGFDALELSAAGREKPEAAGLDSLGVAVITGSDSHFLTQLGTAGTWLTLERPTFEEVRKALRREDGRGWERA